MAGENPYLGGFAALFRTRIREVQMMGLPDDLAERPAFYMRDPLTEDGAFLLADERDVPWDLHATPVDPADLDPLVPVTAGDGDDEVLFSLIRKSMNSRLTDSSRSTPIAEFDVDIYNLLFLDTEWAKVEQFRSVIIGGNTFLRGKEEPPLALYDVTMHVVSVQAVDEG